MYPAFYSMYPAFYSILQHCSVTPGIIVLWSGFRLYYLVLIIYLCPHPNKSVRPKRRHRAPRDGRVKPNHMRSSVVSPRWSG